MTSTGASTELTTPQSSSDDVWTMRTLIARHKRLAIGTLALSALMLALLVAAIAGSTAGAVTDSTSCAGWGTANQNQQQAYAARYVREHGSLRSGARDAASVEASINRGCMQAFGSDVADTVNVYQAINNQY
jgi:hypothetical protein